MNRYSVFVLVMFGIAVSLHLLFTGLHGLFGRRVSSGSRVFGLAGSLVELLRPLQAKPALWIKFSHAEHRFADSRLGLSPLAPAASPKKVPGKTSADVGHNKYFLPAKALN